MAVLDNFWRGRMENLAHLNDAPNLVVVEGDVQRSEDLQRCFDSLGGVDLVHHLAAINGTKWFHEAAMDVIDVNVNGTLATVRKAMEWGARFVLASSPEAYGGERMPLGRRTRVFPPASAHQRFSYGASKYLDEVAVPTPSGGWTPASFDRSTGTALRWWVTITGRSCSSAPSSNSVRWSSTVTVSSAQFHAVDDLVEGFTSSELDRGVDGSALAGASFNIGTTEEVSIRTLAEINRTVGTMAVDMVLGGTPAIQTVAFPMRPRRLNWLVVDDDLGTALWRAALQTGRVFQGALRPTLRRWRVVPSVLANRVDPGWKRTGGKPNGVHLRTTRSPPHREGCSSA